jgi:predicted nucleic acid-binding protein
MPSAARPFVVDASVSAAWFLPDEATPATEAALQATATQDVWVPSIWLLEIGNLLLSAQRRRRITAEKRRELAAAAAALRIRVDREPVAITALDELAARHSLSAYDAAYLELAIRRGLPLATLDEALVAAMGKADVPAASLDGGRGRASSP